MHLLSLTACPTCRIDPGQSAFVAEQNMLAFMLTLTMTMLGIIVLIALNFARKARRAAVASPNLPVS
jgi:heme/copper-type cytochrome/quinol oxidase subunit 2